MASEANTSVLNSIMKVTPQHATFHPFPSLPKELRLQIWEEAVPRERLIRVSLTIPGERQVDPPPRWLEKNHLGKPISGPRYRALAEGHQLNSKFLRVNKEAREVALAFYRVHLPCCFTDPGRQHFEKATLYLNPEHDILHIRADAPVKETLIDFFWDMKAYDPKGLGLLKMALDLEGFCSNDLQYLKRSDILLIRQREALIGTLSQIRELWFAYVEPGMSQPPKSDHTFCHGSHHDACAGWNKIHVSTTSPSVVPIITSISTFNRVGSDPRQGAEAELTRLWMGNIDPREIIWRWNRLLRTWGIQHEPEQVKYRLLVGQRPVSRHRKWHIGTADQAMEFAHVKYRECNGGVPPVSAKSEGEGEAIAEKRIAVGYWLFPVEAVGDVGEGERLLDMDFRPCRFLNMRNYWPELLLSSIS
ncbi:hypothetical protein VM1G_06413 [Cytospora mali]|uniref:2EXR domain-containing protein n=1 Tax=Cytospora mali TaxID=578113 RepID=A0A194W3P6_CYTMA|nr:hypothetical protein VM1G_06413 [Valsa mali]